MTIDTKIKSYLIKWFGYMNHKTSLHSFLITINKIKLIHLNYMKMNSNMKLQVQK